MNRQELKARAKEQIKGKIGILFLITLIVGAVAFAASLLAGFIPFAGYAVTIIVTPALSLSLIRVYLMVIRGLKPDAKDSFSGFDDFFSGFGGEGIDAGLYFVTAAGETFFEGNVIGFRLSQRDDKGIFEGGFFADFAGDTVEGFTGE